MAGLGVQWGLWTSSVLAPSVQQNATASEVIGLDKFILVSAAPTDGETIDSLSGAAWFDTTSAFLASRNNSGPAVQGVSGRLQLGIAASTDVWAGTLNICIGANGCTSSGEVWERWEVDHFEGPLLEGKLQDVELEGQIVTSSFTATGVLSEGGNLFTTESSRPLRGTLSGFLTGHSGEGFVAGFKIFEQIAAEESPSNAIIGTTVFKLPPAISALEIADLDRRGFAIIGHGTKNLGISIGQTSLYSAGNVPLVYSANPGFILRSGNASLRTTTTGINGFDIEWTRWQGTNLDGSLVYNYNLSNEMLRNTIRGFVIVASASPSPEANLTGVHYFETVGQFLATADSTTDSIDNIHGSFDIDLGSGYLTNGKLKLTSSTGAGVLQTWTADTFTGSVSNGILPVTAFNGSISYSDSNSLNNFSGSLTGVFTFAEGVVEAEGASVNDDKFGFLAGFDLLKQGNSERRYGAVLLEKTVLVPVLSSSEYANLHADRFGFALGRAFPAASPNSPLAVYGRVKVNDGDGNANLAGVTETLVSSIASSPLTTNTEPAFIYQRHSAGVSARISDVNETGVTWGKWSISEGDNYKLFTNYANNSQFAGGSDSLLFVNFVPTSQAQLPTTGTRTYLGLNGSTYGAVNHYLHEGSMVLWRLKSAFDIDFSTGNVANGILALCVRGESCGTGSENWEFEYTGSFTQGILTSFNISNTRIDNTSTALTASLAGGFTGSFSGTSNQTYVGGVHIYKNSAPSDHLRAAYLLGVGNYLSADEIIGFNLGEYGILATANGVAGGFAGLFGGHAQRRGNSSNYLLADNALTADSWYDDSQFHIDRPQQIFRKGGANPTVVTNVGGLGSLLTWGEWDSESGARIVRDSLNSTDSELTQDAFWFIATPSAPGQLAGKYASYSSVLAAQGGGNEGEINSGNLSTFGFTLNLDTGAISNGKLKIYTGDNIWTTAFNGQARSKTGTFGPFISLSMSGTSLKAGVDYQSTNISGNIGGMFINSGNQAVAAFAFKNDEGAGQYVSGTAALGKENLTVDWGDWNNSTIANLSGAIETDANNLFAGLQLTPEFVINQLKGEWRYGLSDGSGYGTGSSAGTFSDVDARFDMDFDDGTITNGHLEVISGTVAQKWHLHFNGVINALGVRLDPDYGSLTITDVGTSANVPLIGGASANLGGAFTGANGNGFVGAFDLRDSAPTTPNSVQGVFTLQKNYEISGGC